jgi:hypothetical protein
MKVLSKRQNADCCRFSICSVSLKKKCPKGSLLGIFTFSYCSFLNNIFDYIRLFIKCQQKFSCFLIPFYLF